MSDDTHHLPAPAQLQPGLVRRCFTALGLLVFNIFLIIPTLVVAAMLFSLYCMSIIVFVIGIAVTSSSLAGVNQLVLDGPVRQVILQNDPSLSDEPEKHRRRLRIEIQSSGLQISPEPDESDDVASHAIVSIGRDDGASDSRAKGVFKGCGFIFGGIALVLLSMVITRFTWIGFKRYLRMNLNLLRTPE